MKIHDLFINFLNITYTAVGPRGETEKHRYDNWTVCAQWTTEWICNDRSGAFT